MSRHVAPHRWGDLWAGRVSAAEREAMDRHADDCNRCARARARVKSASDSFSTIRGQAAPDLAWDAVRARVHWEVSSERRARVRPQRPPMGGRIAIGVVACGAAALALLTGPVGLDAPARPAGAPEVAARTPEVAPPAALARPPEAAPAPALVGLVNRATGDVMIDGLRRADPFAHRLGPGASLATGDGRVDVQFAGAGAFALAPRSRLELRRFDSGAIELVVEGTVDVEVSARAPHERFVVIAGDRTIEVRGTQFRVRHEGGATFVACTRGLVAVRDGRGTAEVPAARALELPAGAAVGAASTRALSADEAAALAEVAPMRLPVWDPATLLASSAPLEIATAGRREVRVDGVELGTAPMRVRVMPGRHTVETADAAGRFRRAGWVDVAAPSAGAPPARLEIPAEPPPTRDISERRRQLRTGIDQARVRQCMRQIAKQGLTGTYVQIELAVDTAGAVNFLNVVDTDLGAATARCVRGVLADVRFGPGASATWRERIDL